MNATLSVSCPRSANWPAALRIGFGLIWAIDATLKWLPGFRDSFAAMLDAAAQGQPSGQKRHPERLLDSERPRAVVENWAPVADPVQANPPQP